MQDTYWGVISGITSVREWWKQDWHKENLNSVAVTTKASADSEESSGAVTALQKISPMRQGEHNLYLSTSHWLQTGRGLNFGQESSLQLKTISSGWKSPLHPNK